MSGEKLIEVIRQEKNLEMPIIVISAKTSLESKVETVNGDFKLQIEDVDISRILRESIMDHYKYLEERGLNVLIEIPDEPMIASVDINAIERIFSNILQNAGRYTKTTLKIQMKISKDRLLVVFENDTEEMEEENVEKLFHRFYTSDSARSQENTGLGLTISKHLAENMGGKISAEVEAKENNQWLKITLSV